MDETPPHPGWWRTWTASPAGWLGFGVRQRVLGLLRTFVGRSPRSTICRCGRSTASRCESATGVAATRGALLDGLIQTTRARTGRTCLSRRTRSKPKGRAIHGTAAYVGVASMFEAGGLPGAWRGDGWREVIHRPRCATGGFDLGPSDGSAERVLAAC